MAPAPVTYPQNSKSDAKNTTDELPPSYAPPTRAVRRANVRPHTNPVIEAGHIRARDEVKFTLTFKVATR